MEEGYGSEPTNLTGPYLPQENYLPWKFFAYAWSGRGVGERRLLF